MNTIALRARRGARIGAAAAAALGASTAFAQARIVQPGPPGEPSRLITPEAAIDLASLRYSAADVRFVRDMLVHHAQALEMTGLVEERTNRDAMRLLAQRIALSQEDEIAMMQSWLRAHGLAVSDAAHRDHEAERMPGMATPQQLDALAATEGPAFDALFLELMIEHHRGALRMVEALLEQPGSAQDSVLYELTADITAEQSSEIERMDAMLAGFSPDPRVALKPGFDDAGAASLNLELVTSLPKPPGFFDPEHPAGRPMDREPPELENASEVAGELEPLRGTRRSRGATEAAGDAAETIDGRADPDGAAGRSEDAGDGRSEPRPSLLNFANTDLVFAGDVLVAGNYHGFNIYDISDPRSPVHLSSVVCPGGQGDVSIVGDLLIYSVEQTRGRLDCGLEGVAEAASAERFRGI